MKTDDVIMPQPRFAHQKIDGGFMLFVEHVEFVVGFGEPIERVWARSFVKRITGTVQDLRRVMTLEAKQRGYM